MRRVGRQPCPRVPAAGLEPAASASSARRSYRLSYTGMSKRPWWESNPRHAILQIAASPLDHRIRTEPAVGLEPTRPALRGRCPACRASPASRAASAGVEPTRPEFRAPVPSRGPGQRSRASGGTRTRTRPFTGGVLDRSSCTGVVGPGWIAGYDPTPRRSRGRMRPLHHTHHQSRSSTSWVRSSKSRPASSR